ncbi:hypothetical protein WJT74_05640 [Sphingomicrobium sp. XHP0239]|uniref:hypothetical protein n=1 Tax=Sphingomicrobium maritimum TaxID=3133972 RepID=UPI0031CC4747
MFGMMAFLGALVASSPVTSITTPASDTIQPAMQDAQAQAALEPLPAGVALRQDFRLLNRRLCRITTYNRDTNEELRTEIFRPEDEQFDYCRRCAAGLIPTESGVLSEAAAAPGTVPGVAPIAAGGIGAVPILALSGAGAVALAIAAISDNPSTDRPQSR